MLWTAVRLARGKVAPIGKVPYVALPPSARIFPLGAAKLESNDAILAFPPSGLNINSAGEEGWAIVGDSEGRRLAVETLLGRHRIMPNTPPPGPLPGAALSPPCEAIDRDNWKSIRYLAFARPSITGEFTDYTARYGALQEEDRMLLKDKMASFFDDVDRAEMNVDSALKLMDLGHLKDMPAISLSSGQTRRMRIALALMTRPEVLILEDPMAGLDIPSRAAVSEILGDINATGDEPRVVLVLRDKGDETLAEWVTNVCEVRNGQVWVGTRAQWESRHKEHLKDCGEDVPEGNTGTDRPPIVRLQKINISYGEGTRPVLKDVDWTIRPGERWHLQGANGSGKTTLLSVLLGHHPQSFSLPASTLELFSKPRRLVPTPVLRQLIGHMSPEVFAAFPRNMGLTAFQAIGTGFEGVFSRRHISDTQKERILYLLQYFKDQLATSRTGKVQDMDVLDVARKEFSHFTPPQQALLVFLRAIVSRPPLLVLDEPTQGMDEEIWEKARGLLAREWEEMREERKDQGVIVVSHYNDEVPWKHGKVLRLLDGKVVQSG